MRTSEMTQARQVVSFFCFRFLFFILKQGLSSPSSLLMTLKLSQHGSIVGKATSFGDPSVVQVMLNTI